MTKTLTISGTTPRVPNAHGDKVGVDRVYVKLGENEPLEYDNWVQGIKLGRRLLRR
jgi:hypothetical protein